MLTDEESRTDDGNAFHSFAPLIQKKFSRKSSLVRGIDKGMKDCCCRVFGSVGWQGLKSMSFSMPQYPFRHLNTSIASPRFRLSSRVVRLSFFNLSSYEPLMSLIRRVARCWILSSKWTSFFCQGHHAGTAYST